jgi:hypothetical protein
VSEIETEDREDTSIGGVTWHSSEEDGGPDVGVSVYLGESIRQHNDAAWSREVVKQIAMDIGKETVAYIEVMYPKAIEATSSTFKLSIRNHIYNQIMAAIEVTDEGAIKARLLDRKKFRREWTATYRKIRKKKPDRSAAVPD